MRKFLTTLSPEVLKKIGEDYCVPRCVPSDAARIHFLMNIFAANNVTVTSIKARYQL